MHHAHIVEFERGLRRYAMNAYMHIHTFKENARMHAQIQRDTRARALLVGQDAFTGTSHAQQQE